MDRRRQKIRQALPTGEGHQVAINQHKRDQHIRKSGKILKSPSMPSMRHLHLHLPKVVLQHDISWKLRTFTGATSMNGRSERRNDHPAKMPP